MNSTRQQYTYCRPGPRRQRCPEIYGRIAVAYAKGASLDDIGLAEGCSGNLIGSMLKEIGVTLRPKGGAKSDAFRYVPGRDMKWRPEGDDDEQEREAA